MGIERGGKLRVGKHPGGPRRGIGIRSHARRQPRTHFFAGARLSSPRPARQAGFHPIPPNSRNRHSPSQRRSGDGPDLGTMDCFQDLTSKTAVCGNRQRTSGMGLLDDPSRLSLSCRSKSTRHDWRQNAFIRVHSAQQPPQEYGQPTSADMAASGRANFSNTQSGTSYSFLECLAATGHAAMERPSCRAGFHSH